MTSPASRKVAVALDPGSEEMEYTIDWIIENFLKPDRDDVHLVSALHLNSEFDVTELGKKINQLYYYIVYMVIDHNNAFYFNNYRHEC